MSLDIMKVLLLAHDLMVLDFFEFPKADLDDFSK